MIETMHLTKKFGDFVAVNDLNLKVNQGELFSLLGLNGAGKTTTIKMLSGLIRPSSGSAKLLNLDLIEETQSIKQKINVSPQETAIARNLTVQENLEMIAGIYAIPQASISAKVDEMIQVFNLTDVRKKKARLLSGGTQRRLSIAMALISDPEILFLDEPTLGLDVIARRELWNTIRKLKGRKTIILTTHYLEEAEALSDKVAIIQKGKIKAVGTIAEILALTNKDKLEEAFINLSSEEELL